MITNNRTKKILSKKQKFLTTPLQKAIGLMFKPKLKGCLVFKWKKSLIIGLHMWFVFQSIDVLWLDKNNKVVELLENFRPFTFYTPKKKACRVLELPDGTIRRSKTKLGDTISIR